MGVTVWGEWEVRTGTEQERDRLTEWQDAHIDKTLRAQRIRRPTERERNHARSNGRFPLMRWMNLMMIL